MIKKKHFSNTKQTFDPCKKEVKPLKYLQPIMYQVLVNRRCYWFLNHEKRYLSN